MEILFQGLKVVIAVGLINVWLIRFNKATNYRGGEARTLKEEFQVYGLPIWFCYFIGFFKILAAHALLAGIWLPWLVPPAAALIVVLMIGAVAMHLKVKDPLNKIFPALTMLAMSGTVLYISLQDHIFSQ
jgi:hypothetical protein